MRNKTCPVSALVFCYTGTERSVSQVRSCYVAYFSISIEYPAVYSLKRQLMLMVNSTVRAFVWIDSPYTSGLSYQYHCRITDRKPRYYVIPRDKIDENVLERNSEIKSGGVWSGVGIFQLSLLSRGQQASQAFVTVQSRQKSPATTPATDNHGDKTSLRRMRHALDEVQTCRRARSESASPAKLHYGARSKNKQMNDIWKRLLPLARKSAL